MTPFLQLVFELAIILLAAKAAGYLSLRFKQPSVLGELLVGVLLGPSLINILGLPFINSTSLSTTISELSELGVLLLMFIAGLELHLGELMKHRKVSLLASAGGLLLSIGLGYGAGLAFGMSQSAAFLLGLALGATSVSISARTLMEMGVLRSRVGLSLLGCGGGGRCSLHSGLLHLPGRVFRQWQRSRTPLADFADDPVPGCRRSFRIMGTASAGPPGGRAVHQPGAAGICAGDIAVLWPGGRTGGRDGGAHRSIPGGIDVRPHVRERDHPTGDHHAGLCVIRSYFLRECRSFS